MKNVFEQLEELKGALQTNANTDWSENDPSTEFSALAEQLQNIIDNPVEGCKAFLREKGFFTQNLWSAVDIIGKAEEEGHEITDEQAIEIMDLMGDRFDANHGITWDSIESSIEEYFNN